MKREMLLISLLSIASCDSSDLPKIGHIGKTTSDAASEFGQLFPDRGCNPKVITKLSNKYGPDIKCFLTKHKKKGGGLQIQLTSSKGTIVESRFTYYDDTPMRTNIQIFPKVKDYFGEEIPDYVVKQQQKYGDLNTYTATWEKNSGRAYAFGICAPTTVEGKKNETPKLRDCYLQAMMFFKKTNEALPESFKGKDKEY